MACGFPLANPSGRQCPECGRPFDRAVRRTYARHTWSRHLRCRALNWSASIVAAAALIYIILGQISQSRAQWVPLTASQLRSLHAAAITACATSKRPPPSWFALIWDEYFSPHNIFVRESKRSPRDVVVGQTTLQALLDLPWDKARSLVYALPEPESEWELLGDFLLQRPRDTPTSASGLVVGVSAECPHRPGLRVVVYADNSVAVVTGMEWVASQNDLRADLGLRPLPVLP